MKSQVQRSLSKLVRVPSRNRSPISNRLLKNRQRQLLDIQKRLSRRSDAIRRSRASSATTRRKANWDFYFANGHLGIGVTSGGNRFRVELPIGRRPEQLQNNNGQEEFIPQGNPGNLVQGNDGYVNPYCPNGMQGPDATPINVVSEVDQNGGIDLQGDGGELQGGADANGTNGAQPETGEQFLEAALAEFQQGRLDASLAHADKAATEMPDNTDVHHFRSLVYFAGGDYRQAAAAAHKALTGGPGWDWNTLKQMYPNVATYTAQLRALEKYSDENPNAAEARFLLAYHYLTMGTQAHVDAAAKQLEKAVELEPNDALSAAILKNLQEPESNETAAN